MERTLFPETAAEVRPAQELAALAHEIKVAHMAAVAAERASLEHARQCGELLRKAKAQCPRGKWLPFLKANFPSSQQTASNYMRIAAGWEKLPAVSNLGIREAVALLADTRGGGPKEECAAPQAQTSVTPRAEPDAGRAEPDRPDAPPPPADDLPQSPELVAVAEAAPVAPRPAPRVKFRWLDATTEERHEFIRQWGDGLAFTLLLHAHGWEAAQIAESTGLPVDSIRLFIDPAPPVRFDTITNGGVFWLGRRNERTAFPERYHALVDGCVELFLVEGYVGAASLADGNDFPAATRMAVDVLLREHQRRLERIRASLALAFFSKRDRVVEEAMIWCAVEDARAALGLAEPKPALLSHLFNYVRILLFRESLGEQVEMFDGELEKALALPDVAAKNAWLETAATRWQMSEDVKRAFAKYLGTFPEYVPPPKPAKARKRKESGAPPAEPSP